jgi:hypothetical protein
MLCRFLLKKDIEPLHKLLRPHTGLVWAAHGANDGVSSERRLEHLVLEPPVENEGRGGSEQLVEGDERLPVAEADLPGIRPSATLGSLPS